MFFLFDSTFNSLDVIALLLLTAAGIGAAHLAFPVKDEETEAPDADDFDAIDFRWPEAHRDL